MSEGLIDYYRDSELYIGLVGPVGTDFESIQNELTNFFSNTYGFDVHSIRISKDLIEKMDLNSSKPASQKSESAYERIERLMTAGNEARKIQTDLLASGVSGLIMKQNYPSPKENRKRKVYIINSLKHPDEVTKLRYTYGNGFYLIGVNSTEKERLAFLKRKGVAKDDAKKLIKRDAKESNNYGQKTTDTFHLSDFFINYSKDHGSYWIASLERIIDLIFGHPFETPTLDEFSMYMAFAAGLKSADLSRQIGAVIVKNEEIVGTGANEVPKAKGGQYHRNYNHENKSFTDIERGRDYKRGIDSNQDQREKIIKKIADSIVEKCKDDDLDLNIDKIAKILHKSPLKDITEYGRVVHAEMAAISSCARNGISVQDAALFCTTFPCHNCAKHILCSGIKRVVYIEPYPKSKTLEFHDESLMIKLNDPNAKETQEDKIIFEPFVGVGPRRFLDMFAMTTGASGIPKRRKDKNTGKKVDWPKKNKSDYAPRIPLQPISYLQREVNAYSQFLEKHKDIFENS